MLTAKEEKFCINVFSGMTYTDAYRDAYDSDNMSDKTINEKASLMAKKDKIRTRIQQLRSEANSDKILSAIRRKEILTDIVLNRDNDDSRMKAIDILNKMDGEYITKIEGDIGIKEIRVELEDE